MILTDEQLNAIKARRAAITSYDWMWDREKQHLIAWVGVDKGLGVLRVDENGRLEIRHEDAVFIEYAPADISMLIAALNEVKTERDNALFLLDAIRGHVNRAFADYPMSMRVIERVRELLNRKDATP